MSEQEKKSSNTTGSVVMMEQTVGSRHKPYRPTELQEEGPDLQQKRSRAPAVPSVSEDLKESTNDRREIETVVSEKIKPNLTKKVSSKRRGSSPETITLAPIEVASKKENVVSVPPQTIPSKDQPVPSNILPEKPVEEKNENDDDSITEELAEKRTPGVAKEHSEWSDDEEAGGLPRSDSRSSRVSRVVRQLFCCGVRYEAPSEEDVSSPRGYATGI